MVFRNLCRADEPFPSGRWYVCEVENAEFSFLIFSPAGGMGGSRILDWGGPRIDERSVSRR